VKRLPLLLLFLVWHSCLAAPVASAASDDLARWLEFADRQLPRSAEGYRTSPPKTFQQSANAIEQWAAHLGRFENVQTSDAILVTLERLMLTKQRVDRWLEEALALRSEFVPIQPVGARRAAIRSYLQTESQLIDLSGRLRFVLMEALNFAAFRFASQPADRERLIDLCIEQKSSIGADVMSVALFDPPGGTANRAQPATPEVKAKLLKLIAVTRQLDLVPRVAEFARSLQTTPPLVVAAAETLREVGMPQPERPGEHEEGLPKPAIEPRELHEVLAKIPDAQLSPEEDSRRDDLLAWLEVRMTKGLTEETYRLGSFEVQPGDWLLMRNPSPYNLFTDLSPGLFTHVGVVALEEGTDGIRRMVIVDLPEQGNKMPATSVEVFLRRTLHYVFLRHDDPQAARKMGETAVAVIGNPTEFDLNFRTSRVIELKGKPLAGQKIRTYCAGLLYLCAQETDCPCQEFFPLEEGAAGGRTAENLAKLGMSMGKDFVSPTGALFSPRLKIVGRREPMYDPRREVEEAIFDHFALGLEQRTLSVSPDLYQSLRMKLAEASKDNPVLAQAIAHAAGVSTELDLVAAARAAAVVETLDEVAYSNSGDYRLSVPAITVRGSLEEWVKQQNMNAGELEKLKALRRRHADLVSRLDRERMTPRQLRQELVKYYIERGKTQIDQRFFAKK
jgi:hypothetical protein